MAATPASSSLRHQPATASPPSQPNSMLPTSCANGCGTPSTDRQRDRSSLPACSPASNDWPHSRPRCARSWSSQRLRRTPTRFGCCCRWMRQCEPLRYHVRRRPSPRVAGQFVDSSGHHRRSRRSLAGGHRHPCRPRPRDRPTPRLSDLAEMPNELALDLDATSVVLGLFGSRCTAADVEALHHQTEGWPATSCSRRVSPSRTVQVPGFPSSRRAVGEDRRSTRLFDDQVLSQQSCTRFVRSSSASPWLERLHDRLCQMPCLLGTGTDYLLERALDRINRVFVVPLDDERGWYRFHHLFGELLNDQFERIGTERATVAEQSSGLASRTRHHRRGAPLRPAQRGLRTCGSDRSRTWSEADQGGADRHASILDRALDRRRDHLRRGIPHRRGRGGCPAG